MENIFSGFPCHFNPAPPLRTADGASRPCTVIRVHVSGCGCGELKLGWGGREGAGADRGEWGQDSGSKCISRMVCLRIPSDQNQHDFKCRGEQPWGVFWFRNFPFPGRRGEGGRGWQKVERTEREIKAASPCASSKLPPHRGHRHHQLHG